MKKILVYFGFLLPILVNWQMVSAQSSGQVTIEGKQFKLNGANFYPMVMNYGVELTKQSGSNWLNSYPTPMVEYGVNNGPSGGQNSAFFECTSTSQCENDILNDWLYLRSIGFNSIRVAHFYPRYNENGLVFGFKGRETSPFLPFYTFSIDPFNSLDPGLVLLLDQYEKLMEIANNADVKLIFNMIGKSSQFTVISGPGNDELDYYTAFMEKLAIRVSSSPFKSAVLAYDLWNEPCYFDLSNNKTKQTTCEIISTFAGAIKAQGSTPLVTIGTCGSGDVWFYDPGILKVDFHSLHVYPDFKDFEDRTDPIIQQRAISRMFDELYWFNKNSPVPWIIGETGFAASMVLPLTFPGTNGAHGTLTDQADFVQQMLDATCNSGGSGFSWWSFQDGWYFENSPFEAHWGMLERGYATGDVAGEKPMVNVFRNYSLPTDNNSCGPSPVDETTLQTYNPALTYFNPFQHPSNPQYTIKGYIYDQDGNPIANAYVGGHTMTYYHSNPAKQRHPYYRLFTNENGYFEIIPEPFDLTSSPHSFLGELHTLFISMSGGERLKYSAFWTPINASNVMPATNTTHTWMLNHINFKYDGEVHDIIVTNGESRNLEASNSLDISNVTLEPGSIVNIRAKEKVHVNPSFHVTSGSSTHIYCESTSIICSNYNGYIMEYKLAGSANSPDSEGPSFIDLVFKNKNYSNTTFTVIPNPASATIKIRSEKSGRLNFILKNLLGQRIAEYAFNSESNQIDVSGLARGVYLLVEMETGNVQKLILQ